jgi:hypothetical protein
VKDQVVDCSNQISVGFLERFYWTNIYTFGAENRRYGMNFKRWLCVNEMASFSIPEKDRFVIPCGMVNMSVVKMPCEEKPVGALDMRFEGPPPYDHPYNKLNNGSKFAALIPRSTEYLVYNGTPMIPPLVLPEPKAVEMGFLPVKETPAGGKPTIDRTPGAMSPKGYVLVPDYWYVRAELLGPDYEVIKPALGDVTGERQKFLYGNG